MTSQSGLGFGFDGEFGALEEERAFGVNSAQVWIFLEELRELDLDRAVEAWEGHAAAQGRGYPEALEAAAHVGARQRPEAWARARQAAELIVRKRLDGSIVTDEVVAILANVAGAIVVRDLLSRHDFTLLRAPWTRRSAEATTPAEGFEAEGAAAEADAELEADAKPGAELEADAKPEAEAQAHTEATDQPEPDGGPVAASPVLAPLEEVLARAQAAPAPAVAAEAESQAEPVRAATAPAQAATATPTATAEPAIASTGAPATARAVKPARTKKTKPKAGAGALGSGAFGAGALGAGGLGRVSRGAWSNPLVRVGSRTLTVVGTVLVLALVTRATPVGQGPAGSDGAGSSFLTPGWSIDPGIAMGTTPSPGATTPSPRPLATQTTPPAGATPQPEPTRAPAPTPRPTPPPPPPPTPAPTPAICTVISLLDLATAKAQQQWAAAGFTSKINFSPDVPPQYKIAWQSLTPGDKVSCGHGIIVSDHAP